jgi:hypothetical protein
MPADLRTARCSDTMPAYCTGISHPAKGTRRAPRAACRSNKGVRRSVCTGRESYPHRVPSRVPSPVYPKGAQAPNSMLSPDLAHVVRRIAPEACRRSGPLEAGREVAGHERFVGDVQAAHSVGVREHPDAEGLGRRASPPLSTRRPGRCDGATSAGGTTAPRARRTERRSPRPARARPAAPPARAARGGRPCRTRSRSR